LGAVVIGRRKVLLRLVDDAIRVVVEAVNLGRAISVQTLILFVDQPVAVVVLAVHRGRTQPVGAAVVNPVVVVIDIADVSDTVAV